MEKNGVRVYWVQAGGQLRIVSHATSEGRAAQVATGLAAMDAQSVLFHLSERDGYFAATLEVNTL